MLKGGAPPKLALPLQETLENRRDTANSLSRSEAHGSFLMLHKGVPVLVGPGANRQDAEREAINASLGEALLGKAE